jgi:hypothetical protein
MTVANLFNVPETEDLWNVWSFSNQDHHRAVNDAILKQMGEFLPLYIMDPMQLSDLSGWAQNHQQAHNDVNSALGTAGFDLTGLDLDNPGQIAAFVRLHATEHQVWAQKLGV